MNKIKAIIFKSIYDTVEQRIVYPLLLLRDRIRGVDFYRIELRKNTEPSPDSSVYDIYLYESTHLRTDRQLRKICRHVSKNDAILDVGCGKGRMLEFFSRYPFRKADGLEVDKGLSVIAKSNMHRLGLSSKVYNVDARDFEHWDRYNYYYFYNPFPKEVMDVCLDHIVLSLFRRPRKITALYANPACHLSFIEHGFKEVPVRLDQIERIWQPYLSGLKMYKR